MKIFFYCFLSVLLIGHLSCSLVVKPSERTKTTRILLLPMLPEMQFHIEKCKTEPSFFAHLSFPVMKNLEQDWLAHQIGLFKPSKIFIDEPISQLKSTNRIYQRYKANQKNQKSLHLEYFPFYLAYLNNISFIHPIREEDPPMDMVYFQKMAQTQNKIFTFEQVSSEIDLLANKVLQEEKKMSQRILEQMHYQNMIQNYESYYKHFFLQLNDVPHKIGEQLENEYFERMNNRVQNVLKNITEGDHAVVFARPQDLFVLNKIFSNYYSLIHPKDYLSQRPNVFYYFYSYSLHVINYGLSINFWLFALIIMAIFAPFAGYFWITHLSNTKRIFNYTKDSEINS